MNNRSSSAQTIRTSANSFATKPRQYVGKVIGSDNVSIRGAKIYSYGNTSNIGNPIDVQYSGASGHFSIKAGYSFLIEFGAARIEVFTKNIKVGDLPTFKLQIKGNSQIKVSHLKLKIRPPVRVKPEPLMLTREGDNSKGAPDVKIIENTPILVENSKPKALILPIQDNNSKSKMKQENNSSNQKNNAGDGKELGNTGNWILVTLLLVGAYKLFKNNQPAT